MTMRRSCVGITELDGIMYAIGGYDGYTCLDYMERYDPHLEVRGISRDPFQGL